MLKNASQIRRALTHAVFIPSSGEPVGGVHTTPYFRQGNGLTLTRTVQSWNRSSSSRCRLQQCGKSKRSVQQHLPLGITPLLRPALLLIVWWMLLMRGSQMAIHAHIFWLHQINRAPDVLLFLLIELFLSEGLCNLCVLTAGAMAILASIRRQIGCFFQTLETGRLAKSGRVAFQARCIRLILGRHYRKRLGVGRGSP